MPLISCIAAGTAFAHARFCESSICMESRISQYPWPEPEEGYATDTTLCRALPREDAEGASWPSRAKLSADLFLPPGSARAASNSSLPSHLPCQPPQPVHQAEWSSGKHKADLIHRQRGNVMGSYNWLRTQFAHARHSTRRKSSSAERGQSGYGLRNLSSAPCRPGFAPYALVDPVIVADTDGARFIPSDAALQVEEILAGFPSLLGTIPTATWIVF